MDVTTKWLTLTDVKRLTFLNKDVIAGYNSVNILFHNLTTNIESIYMTQNDVSGDGIECFAGHKNTYIFAYADKSDHSIIYMMTYPDFKEIVKLKDNVIKRFVALELVENEYTLALSIQPSCKLTIWSWRTEQKLITHEAGIDHLEHAINPSSASPFFLQIWETNFCLWEIVPTHKSCLLHNRFPNREISNIVDFAWNNEGSLYAIDNKANLYSIITESIHLAILKEWSSQLNGEENPCITFYKSGFVIYGPDMCIRHLKKNSKEWHINWTYKLESMILKILSSSNGELLFYVSDDGSLVKLQRETDSFVENVITVWQRNIQYLDFIYPDIDKVISLHSGNIFCTWKCNTGKLISRYKLSEKIFYIKCNPVKPVVALAIGFDDKNGVGLLTMDDQKQTSICLTKHQIGKLIWSDSGKELLAGVMEVGQLFYIRISEMLELTMSVLYFIDIEKSFDNMWIGKIDSQLFFVIGSENDFSCYNPSTNKFMKNNLKNLKLNVFFVKDDYIFDRTSMKTITPYKLTLNNDIVNVKSENGFDFETDINGVVAEIDSQAVFWDNNSFFIVNLFPKMEIIQKVEAYHIFGEELKLVITKFENEVGVSLTKCGNITMYSFGKPIDKKLEVVYEKTDVDYIQLPQYFDENTESWISKKIKEDLKVEEEHWSIKRNNALTKYNGVKEKLAALLEANQNAEPLYKLPLKDFRLCSQANIILFEKAESERELLNNTISNQITDQDKITDWIKSKCWDPVEIHNTELHAIFSDKRVENYSLLPKNEKYFGDDFTSILKNMEKERRNLLILNWKQLIKENIQDLKIQNASSNLSLALDVNNEIKSDVPEDEKFDGIVETTACQFVETQPFISSQMLLHSFMQMNWYEYKTKKMTFYLQMYFNSKFQELMQLKSKKLNAVISENNRLKYIISELNALNKLKGVNEVIEFSVMDPTWKQEEKPERLITVQSDEVKATPYISLGEISESISTTIVIDEFYERKLMEMMDGALEILWEEEIKKPIPKPRCMIDKFPHEYTKADMKDISDWEESVRFQETEREKYRNMLHEEYDRRSSAANDTINNFNKMVDDLYLLKLKVESAIGQEELKMMLLRVHSLDRIEAAEKYKELELEMIKLENEQEQIYVEASAVQSQLIECHAAHEILLSRDRMLEKNFKANLGEVSPLAMDLCLKLFKKRPKWQQKSSMNSGVLYEMAISSLTRERTLLLHHDCLDYLKSIDQMDSLNNMPSVIEEPLWVSFCKLRRIKIENEIKMRAVSAEIADVEAANVACQKKINACKMHLQKLKTDISNHRHYMEKLARNFPMQLIVKGGLVEIEMTGHLEDFDEAVMTNQEAIEAINKEIQKAAQKKMNAVDTTSKFKKRLLDKEWEHATLKMQIKELEDDLFYFERLKVTKEIQSYITDKELKFKKGNLENKIVKTKAHFDRQLLIRIQNVEELELKIESINSQMLSLDNLINNTKKDIHEQRKDDPRELIEQQNATKRIHLFIARNKLLTEIQRQHTTIILLQTELELQRLRTYPTLSVIQSDY